MMREILQQFNEVKLEPWGDATVSNFNKVLFNYRNTSTPQLTTFKGQTETLKNYDQKEKITKRIRLGKTSQSRKRSNSYQYQYQKHANSHLCMQAHYQMLLNQDNEEDTAFKPLNATKKTLEPFKSQWSSQKQQVQQNPTSLKTVFLGYIDNDIYCTQSKKNPIRQFLHNRRFSKLPINKISIKTTQKQQDKVSQFSIEVRKRPATMATHRTIEQPQIKNNRSFYIKQTLLNKDKKHNYSKMDMQNKKIKGFSSNCIGKSKAKYFDHQKIDKVQMTNQYNNFIVKSFKVKRNRKSQSLKFRQF